MNLTNTLDLKESFKYGYEEYEPSRLEADEVLNMYHNRQWTGDQSAILANRGQPQETFNVIKLFARMLVGYYSTVVNTARALPTQTNDITMASMGTDLISAVMERNHFVTEGDKVKLSAMLEGLMCVYMNRRDTGERDRFGRPIYTIDMEHVPSHEIVLDPMSVKEDYSDARWMHRFKWVPYEELVKEFGKAKVDSLEEFYNYLEVPEAEFGYSHPSQFTGRYRVFNNYLLTHSVVQKGKDRYAVWWCGDVILRKKKITFKKVRWTYRVVKTHTSNITEYYGIFREIVETQKAINQALVKLQLMANSEKIFVEEGSVENIDEFTAAVNRVTGVIPVAKLKGIKVEQMAREALEQYKMIDHALDRIQRILSVNDSFLGMAFASDSGRKVKLQQNATIMALRYLTERIQLMYRLLGEDILGLATQYMTAEQVLRVTDELTGFRFIELNKPMEIFSGQLDEQGQPIMEPVFEQVMDPENKKPLEVDGNFVFAPIPEEETEVNFDKLDLTIESNAYNDEDERAQLMIDTVISGPMGQLMSQVNPAGYFKIGGLTLRTMKTRYSAEISEVFDKTSEMLAGNQEASAQASAMASNNPAGGQTQDAKLPQGEF